MEDANKKCGNIRRDSTESACSNDARMAVISAGLQMIRGSGNKKMHSDYLRVDKRNH